MPLKSLSAEVTGIRDLRPLRDSPLEEIFISDDGNLTSLDGIQKMPLRSLSIFRTSVEDLSPLSGSPVKYLWMSGCGRVRDLKPLMDCKQLEGLTLPEQISDIAFLKNHPSLKRLSHQSIAEFFGWNAGKIPTVAEFFQKNGERLARQVPMEKQLEKFRQSLIAQGNDPEKLRRYQFDADGNLEIYVFNLKCSDISELRGVAVTLFYCNSNALSDLSPLAGAPLDKLELYKTSVSDLSPLRSAPLREITLNGSPVKDLSPLRGMQLQKVALKDTVVTDVSLLATIPSLQAILLPAGAKGIETLRSLPKLALISYRYTGNNQNIPAQTAADFWKEFDAKKGAAPQ